MATEFNPLLDSIKKALDALDKTDQERNAAIAALKEMYEKYIDCCCHEIHFIVSKKELGAKD